MRVQSGRELLRPCLTRERNLEVADEWPSADSDLVCWLAKETIDQGNGVLIFCGTKWVPPPPLPQAPLTSLFFVDQGSIGFAFCSWKLLTSCLSCTSTTPWMCLL